MDLDEYHCTPMLRFYQRIMAADNAMRLNNQARLMQLKQMHGRAVRLFCAHDAKELEMFPPLPPQTAPIPVPRTEEPVQPSPPQPVRGRPRRPRVRERESGTGATISGTRAANKVISGPVSEDR